MTRINLRRNSLVFAALAIAIIFAGCGKPTDERLADFAERTMTEQARQNQRMAEQSQAVVAESHQLAEAAKELVVRDAEARREMISANQSMTSQLQEQQATIVTGHDKLEQERREIARQRHRDPIIAAAIDNFGLVIACLLPLLVAVYVIRQMRTQEPDHAAVAELLVLELTSDQPRLLPQSTAHQMGLTQETKKEASSEMIRYGTTDDNAEFPS
jgi:hypothetical protein